MYKEKVVASYIVSVLGKTPLKQDEIDVLLAFCEKDINTNSKLIRIVVDMIRGTDLNPGSPEFMGLVYDRLMARLVAKDEDLRLLLAKIDELERVVDEDIESVKKETPAYRILYSYLPFDQNRVLVTESVSDENGSAMANAVLTHDEFLEYQRHVMEHAEGGYVFERVL